MKGAFRSLLVPVDLSPVSDWVIRRATLLPLADAVSVTLLHVVPRTLSQDGQRLARREAASALAAETKRLAKVIPKGATIRPVVTLGAPAAQIAKCAASVNAELIVMGRFRSHPHEGFLGSTAERVIRRGQVPVLVVRARASTQYRRPAIAVDLDKAAANALRFLLRVVPAPRPPVTLIHAHDTPYYTSLPRDEADMYDAYRRGEAASEIEKLLATAAKDAGASGEAMPRWEPIIRGGAPRVVVPAVVKKAKADLLVLGTRGRTGVVYAYLGSVAGDLIRSVECDVLVTPARSR